MEITKDVKKVTKKDTYSHPRSKDKTTVKDGITTVTTTSVKTLKVVEIIEIDWDKIKSGTYFKATVGRDTVIGRIQKKDGSIYLCSNNEDMNDEDYDEKFDLLGLTYYYCIEDGDENDLSRYDIENIRFYDHKPRGFKTGLAPIVIYDEVVEFHKGYIDVGCQEIPNKVIMEVVKRLKGKKT